MFLNLDGLWVCYKIWKNNRHCQNNKLMTWFNCAVSFHVFPFGEFGICSFERPVVQNLHEFKSICHRRRRVPKTEEWPWPSSHRWLNFGWFRYEKWLLPKIEAGSPWCSFIFHKTMQKHHGFFWLKEPALAIEAKAVQYSRLAGGMDGSLFSLMDVSLMSYCMEMYCDVCRWFQMYIFRIRTCWPISYNSYIAPYWIKKFWADQPNVKEFGVQPTMTEKLMVNHDQTMDVLSNIYELTVLGLIIIFQVSWKPAIQDMISIYHFEDSELLSLLIFDKCHQVLKCHVILFLEFITCFKNHLSLFWKDNMVPKPTANGNKSELVLSGDLLKDAMSLEMDDSLEELRQFNRKKRTVKNYVERLGCLMFCCLFPGFCLFSMCCCSMFFVYQYVSNMKPWFCLCFPISFHFLLPKLCLVLHLSLYGWCL